MSAGGVLCAGRLYCDLVFTGLDRLPTLGTETFADGLGLYAGGGAFITAAYLAALGRPASLAATLPADPFRALVQADLARFGVGADLCRAAPEGSDPQITVAMTTAQDRAFLTRASGPALPRLGPDQMAAPGLRHLHIGELRTLADNPWLLEVARKAGLSVSLDCGWEDDLPDKAGALIAGVDLFLPNDAEAQRFLDQGIALGGPMLTVIKRGAAGAVALKGTDQWEAAGHPARTVDTTGAGDAFNGGFLDRWLAGAPVPDCLEAGNRCGAAAVAAVGGTGGISGLRDARPVPVASGV
ncbi:carbohydrate kinase family protein [Aestuariibius insulae]|uniref:carbohydrate kinase family protein n=1 Tax=Aestuariibius insulae TaxID=2058287 RepID=UPI00345EB11B